jgi:hypothetical protein
VLRVTTYLALHGYSDATFDTAARDALRNEVGVWLVNTTNYNPGTAAPTIETEVGVGYASGMSWSVPVIVTTDTTRGAFQVQDGMRAIANSNEANARFVNGFRARVNGIVPLNFGIEVGAITTNRYAETGISNAEFCRQFATSHELADPCCATFPGCSAALALVSTFQAAEVFVIADIVFAGAAFISCLALAAKIRSNDEKSLWWWRSGNLCLLLLAVIDAFLSLTVKHELESNDAGGLLEQLFSSECFSRADDRALSATKSTIDDYVGTIIVAQVTVAVLGAVVHFAAALRPIDVENTVILSKVGSVVCEIGELIAAIIGFKEFAEAKQTFMDKYSLMAGSQNAGSGGICTSPSSSSYGTGAGAVTTVGGIAGALLVVLVAAFMCKTSCCRNTRSGGGGRGGGGIVATIMPRSWVA